MLLKWLNNHSIFSEAHFLSDFLFWFYSRRVRCSQLVSSVPDTTGRFGLYLLVGRPAFSINNLSKILGPWKINFWTLWVKIKVVPKFIRKSEEKKVKKGSKNRIINIYFVLYNWKSYISWYLTFTAMCALACFVMVSLPQKGTTKIVFLW